MRIAAATLILALGLPGLVLAQSAPLTGAGAAAVHGQRPDMRQDLHNAPGAPTAAGGRAAPLAPETRTQAVRRQSTQAQRQQQRRATEQRRHATQGQAARVARTGTGTPGGRTPDSIAAQEARLADARRRQAEAAEAAARAQPGVR